MQNFDNPKFNDMLQSFVEKEMTEEEKQLMKKRAKEIHDKEMFEWESMNSDAYRELSWSEWNLYRAFENVIVVTVVLGIIVIACIMLNAFLLDGKNIYLTAVAIFNMLWIIINAIRQHYRVCKESEKHKINANKN